MFNENISVYDLLKAKIENTLVTSSQCIRTHAKEARSFSKLKQVKRYLRSTMGLNRLSSAALLSIVF
jgi:hypothetical protein